MARNRMELRKMRCSRKVPASVVDLTDIVLAVWDGQPAKGKGGTADVVAYVLRRSVPLIHIDPAARIVRQLRGE